MSLFTHNFNYQETKLNKLTYTHQSGQEFMFNLIHTFYASFFSMAHQPLVGQGLLIIEASRSHPDTPHLVGLRASALHFRGFAITLRHATLGRTPLDEGSAQSRNLYLTTHNTRKRQISMSPSELEPAIPASERPQPPAWARTATGIGCLHTSKKFVEKVTYFRSWPSSYVLVHCV
jgi:hypothetical protein